MTRLLIFLLVPLSLSAQRSYTLTSPASLNKINTFNNGDTVTLKGSWQLTQTLFIEKAVIIRGNAIISGLASVSNWRKTGSNIWEANVTNVPGIDGVRTVVIGHELKAMASASSQEWKTVLPIRGAEVVTRNNRYEISRPRNSLAEEKNSFLQNHRSFLKKQNDWCYDKTTGSLVMYSLQSPRNIRVAMLDQTIYIKPSAKGFTMSGIRIEGGETLAVHNQASNVTVTNCDLQYAGDTGFFSDATVSNVKISKCRFRDMNAAAIFLIENNHCVIEKNSIQRIGLNKGSGNPDAGHRVGMNISGDNNAIIENTLDSTGYSGIVDHGTRAKILSNRITHYCLNLDDGGAIYLQHLKGALVSFNTALYPGMNSAKGTNDPNYFFTYAFYVDDDCEDIELSFNTAIAAGDAIVMIHNSRNIRVQHNQFKNGRVRQVYVYHDNASYFLPEKISIINNVLTVKPGQSLVDVKSIIPNKEIKDVVIKGNRSK